MKNRAFAAFLALLVLFLAILWEQDNRRKTELLGMESRFNRLQNEMRALKLRAQALKTEIELIEISNRLQFLRETSPGNMRITNIQSQGERK